MGNEKTNGIQPYHKPLKELTLLDRFLFREAMDVPELGLQDGARRIFINIKGRNREAFSEEFTDLLDYLNAAAEDAESGIRTEAVRCQTAHCGRC